MRCGGRGYEWDGLAWAGDGSDEGVACARQATAQAARPGGYVPDAEAWAVACLAEAVGRPVEGWALRVSERGGARVY